MDRETLSNYSWIVVLVLVLSVMIAMATPFGKFISNAVMSITDGLIDVNSNLIDNTLGDFGIPTGIESLQEKYQIMCYNIYTVRE